MKIKIMTLSESERNGLIPYMQYFAGLDVFSNKPMFDPSLFVYIRKRLDVDSFNEMSLALMEEGEEENLGNEDENNDDKGD